MHAPERRPAAPGLAFALLLATVGLLAQGCGTTSTYRWVDELPDDDVPVGNGEPEEYRIAPRDVLGVRVWNQEPMSLARARVREDGRLSLPFVKDVVAAGLTPSELGRKLQEDLVSVIVDPVVTVTLEEPAPLNVSVVGEVAHPGMFSMTRGAGVLHALAAAGGLTAYAERNGIYVLRRLTPSSPAPTRIRFKYGELTSGGTAAAGFLMQSGDVVIVE